MRTSLSFLRQVDFFSLPPTPGEHISAGIGPRFPGGVWHTGLDLMIVFNFPRPLTQLLTLQLCHCLGIFISVLKVTFQYSAKGLQTLLKCSYRAISLHCLVSKLRAVFPIFLNWGSEIKLMNTSLNPKGHYQVIVGERHLQNLSLPLQLHARFLL